MAITRDALRQHCLAKREVVEYFPFGADPSVFSVAGKMFAYLPLDEVNVSITFKCEPVEAQLLRAQYRAVTPGYHMDKRHWVTVQANADLPAIDLLELLDNAYVLVARKLPRTLRQQLLS